MIMQLDKAEKKAYNNSDYAAKGNDGDADKNSGRTARAECP